MTAGASTWSSAPAAEGKADRTASVSGAAARGPVWVNTNWLVWRGLRQHGRTSLAREVEESVIRLVERSGFREYFDPFDGEGYGSPDFSWTAALLIDMLQSRSRSIGGVS